MFRRISQVSLAAWLIAASAFPGFAQQSPSHPATVVEINDLTAQSDFTLFMRKDVPEEVRRIALRRLWVLMQLPVSCDGLCYLPEPAAPGFTHLASEKLPASVE